MRRRHQVSRSGVDMIKTFEGFRPRAARTPTGRWTVGYGHTRSTREDTVVSERDAQALLLYDLMQVTHDLNETVFAPLSQNQFDALVSFAYNIGSDNFSNSAVLKHLNAGEPLRAALSMDIWRKAMFRGESVVIDSLVRRRAAERSLFLTPQSGWVPAPSALLPPQIDHEAAQVLPIAHPFDVTADDEANLVLNAEVLPGDTTEDVLEPSADQETDPAIAPFPAAELASRADVSLASPSISKGVEPPADAVLTDPDSVTPAEILDVEFTEDASSASPETDLRTFPLADEHQLTPEDSAFADALPEAVPELELPPRAPASLAESSVASEPVRHPFEPQQARSEFGPVHLPEPPADTSGRTWQLLALTGGGLVVFILGLLNGLNAWAGEGLALWAWLAAGVGALAMAFGTYWLLKQISGILED